MRKVLAATLAACTFGLASGGALAVECFDIRTIGAWEDAGSCTQGDKTWTLNTTDLADPITVLFFNPVPGSHGMVVSGFDTSDLPGAWALNYTISVTDNDFYISSAFADSNSTGPATSLVTKNITGDEIFTLTVFDGVPDEQLGLDALTLTVDELITVQQGEDLQSVTNVFNQSQRGRVPEPATLILLGLGLLAAGAAGRRRS